MTFVGKCMEITMSTVVMPTQENKYYVLSKHASQTLSFIYEYMCTFSHRSGHQKGEHKMREKVREWMGKINKAE